MRRSGAFALGAVLMLGGAAVGRGDELSDSAGLPSPASPSASSVPLPSLPSLPANWADLPFRLTASETVSYNSNILGIPIGTPGPPGSPLGDFTATSNFGVSTKANVYNQQFYLDGNFGIIRYMHYTASNSLVYSFSSGMDWTLTSRCSGTLSATFLRTPGALNEIVGSGINYSTTESFGESGRCAISNAYSALMNARVTRYGNSNAVNGLNDSRSTMVSAGIEYAKGPTTLSALATISTTDYSNRGAAVSPILGLANSVVYHSLSLNYTRIFSPLFSLTAHLGLTGVTDDLTLALPKSISPTYGVSAGWTITPKLRMSVNGSRSIATPTTVVANAQTTYTAGANLSYAATAKIGISAGGSISYATSTFTPGAVVNQLLGGGSQRFYTAQMGMSYSLTPFLSAGLSAAYIRRVQGTVITPQDLITVTLNYRPY